MSAAVRRIGCVYIHTFGALTRKREKSTLMFARARVFSFLPVNIDTAKLPRDIFSIY
jgi:hypothetical protein